MEIWKPQIRAFKICLCFLLVHWRRRRHIVEFEIICAIRQPQIDVVRIHCSDLKPMQL